ncbi:MAG: winged helix-turn-helix domain-containing protein, partial [Clostridiales bacterium]|nr:winged helix-turn-helix domain-containing protein [Clostridiales bacterium]
KADNFVNNAVDTLMEVVDYEGVVSVSKEIGTPEDFSNIPKNYPRSDFEKKYNHTGAKTKVNFSSVQAEAKIKRKRTASYTIEEMTENSVLVEDFFNLLDDTDRMILKYVLSGYTQSEIAEEMGFSNHSVVSKHMKKIRKMYLEFDPDCKVK